MENFLEIERGFEEILRAPPVRYSVVSEISKSPSVPKPPLPHQTSGLLKKRLTNPKIFEKASSFPDEIPLTETKLKFDPADEKKCALNKLLLEAIRYRDVEAIEKLLVSNANPNATCSAEYISACHLAALRPDGALSMVLSHGAERNRADLLGRTPLHVAAWAGNIRQCAMLLGFPKDLISKLGSTTITDPVESEVRTVSQFLSDVVNAQCTVSTSLPNLPKEWADSTVDHNCMDFVQSLPLLLEGSTPLHGACLRAKSQCVRLLVAAGAELNLRDEEGKTPLDVLGSAYYADEYIDRVNFADAVAVLIGARAEFSIKNLKVINTPLHVAVELNSLDAVKALMTQIPIGRLNHAGLSPLHICIKKRLREIFLMLVKDKLEIENMSKLKSAADLRDSAGHTVLHAAIIEGWEQGVFAAIDTGANVLARTNKGDTSLHLAAAEGNVEILNKIIDATRNAHIIDEYNSDYETALIKAVQHGHAECVKKLLEENALVKKTKPGQINILHIAAEKGNLDVLTVLLEKPTVRNMIDHVADDKNGFGPIHYSIFNNHLKCVEFLLSKSAYKDLKTSLTGNYLGATGLHLAAMQNNVEIAKMLVRNDPNAIRNVDNLGWTPLHTACSYGHRDMIVLLLKEGADLSAIATDRNDKRKVTAIDLLMNGLSKPTDFLSSFFDTCISTNGVDIQDPKCEITVDYRVLAPTAEGKEQIKVIDALIKTGDKSEQSQLLLHPLLESFLYLKWKALLPFFYTMIVAYAMFVFTLTTYVITVFFYKDNADNERALSSNHSLSIMVYITSFVVVILEGLYVTINTRYFLNLETWIKFGAMLLALSLPNAISNLKDGLDEYPRHIATFALLLSWLEMLFLVSRFPNWGYYVLMFGKVSMNVIKILITFSFLVIGFALSFMIQFHHNSDFDTPWAAFVKILVMMTAELNYSDLLKEKYNIATTTSNGTTTTLTAIIDEIFSPVLIFRLMFICFVILGTIVLMNLMVGVAVNDLHNLEVLGNIKRLSKQVEFLGSLDTLLYNRYFRRYIPKTLETMILKRKTILSIMTIYPSDPKSKNYKTFPISMRNSIFEKAHALRQQLEDEQGSLSYKKKLDEIYEATIKNKRAEISDKNENNGHRKSGVYDDSGERRTDNVIKNNIDLDSGIIDGNRQTAEILNEMRTMIMRLELKVNMLYNESQTDKIRKEL